MHPSKNHNSCLRIYFRYSVCWIWSLKLQTKKFRQIGLKLFTNSTCIHIPSGKKPYVNPHNNMVVWFAYSKCVPTNIPTNSTQIKSKFFFAIINRCHLKCNRLFVVCVYAFPLRIFQSIELGIYCMSNEIIQINNAICSECQLFIVVYMKVTWCNSASESVIYPCVCIAYCFPISNKQIIHWCTMANELSWSRYFSTRYRKSFAFAVDMASRGWWISRKLCQQRCSTVSVRPHREIEEIN